MRTVIVVVVVGALIGWLGLFLSRGDAAARASSEVPSEDPPNAVIAELRRIGSSMDALASRVSRIENRPDRIVPAPESSSASESADKSEMSDAELAEWDALPKAEKAAREQKAFAHYFGVLDQKRLSERSDADWQYAVDERARKVVEHTAEVVEQAPTLTQSDVVSVDCGTTLCRIEAKHDSTDAQDEFQVWFLRGMRSNASLWRQDGKSIVYVAREGHTLPVWAEVMASQEQ
jgi:hypothetical protein